MSNRSEKHHYLINAIGGRTPTTASARLKSLLLNRMHGVSFSAYTGNQKPGDEISVEQIEHRMATLSEHFNWVRSFSVTEGNQHIPRVAKTFGIKTLVGAWLGGDAEKNRTEIERLIALCHEGCVDIAAVGNEVLYREELTEEELLGYINEVKARVPRHIPVGYVDAYYEFEDRPQLTKTCDVLLANCYPFWEGCALPYATLYMQDMYRRVKRVANGKRVIISETGWPSAGGAHYGAEAGKEGALNYFLRAMEWAQEEGIELFYFSSFDEAWKTTSEVGEGAVGAHWGLWDQEEAFKYVGTLD